MHRAVTALLGPTNTGKTHLAIERMLTHPTGMIGFPLRLLARENYDRVAARRGPGAVALVTGEERIVPRSPSYWMCTVEAMPLDLRVDYLAVDEIQLAADRERGHAFTDRILNARGRLETWLIGADTVRPLLRRLLPDAAFDTRPRLSNLSYSDPKRIAALPPRSAVIVFSLRELYEVAARLRRERGGAALVFGALSPRTRNAQVGLYQAGEVDHLVATDAIGMGLNLDIDHVVFTGLTKFDGVGPRALTPAEVAQIAGRAGRHVRDGHFAATAELGPLDPRLVEAVEGHRFAPLARLYWRTGDLDFFSPLALLGSLDRPPPLPFLQRMSHAEDQGALAALTRDAEVMALARGVEAVRLLWEVCQVPDFQGVVTEGHARLLSRVFRFLRAPAGRIPEDFLATHVRDIDRTDGDVDALLGRIAAIRTWTYLSHRASWVPEAQFWQERTRAVEDRLSDALHERLTLEFVDRPGTVIARHDPSDLVTSVGADGEVAVQGLRAGVLDGFRFRPDPSVREGSRGLLAAANRALAGLARERVEALEREEDSSFALGPGAGVLWRGATVARLAAGESALQPLVDVLPSDLLDPPLRERVRRRLAAWLEAHVRSVLRPLFGLREGAPPGVARGLAFALGEGLGAVPRRSVAQQVAALTPDDRRALSGLGVVVGRLSLFLPALQRPPAMRLRARLFAVGHGRPAEPGPDGAPSVPHDPARPAAFYLACGYLPAGPRAVRLDRLERAAAVAARLSRGGSFLPPRDLAPILGCGPDDVPAVLTAMGYVERDGRFERRPRALRSRVAPRRTG
ncbi:MAG TPA: helicase-related protein [Vicinamibacteria bacterium]|nr:helicase-related protein [Vicinamibacteria bacterium]